MKTALIIGFGAVAVYAVWRLAQATSSNASIASQPLYPTNSPYPAAPATVPNPALVSASVGAALATGKIASSTPVATNLNVSQSAQAQAQGLVIIRGNAYPPGAGGSSRVGGIVSSANAAPTGPGGNIPGYHNAPPPAGLTASQPVSDAPVNQG